MHAVHVVFDAGSMCNLKIAVVASVPKLASVTADVIQHVEEICFGEAAE
jgi:hypothetical protein